MEFPRDPKNAGWLREAIAVLIAIGFAMAGRIVIDMFAPGVLPFALTFPAVIFASLLAGPRAGAMAIIICQAITWYFVFQPSRAFTLTFVQGVSMIFSTLSLCLTVWIVGAYRAAGVRLQQESQRRVDLLSLALREVDHRTKNNFQIAASLLFSQAAAQSDPTLAQELRDAAGRLMSIAGVYADLALSSTDLHTIMLHEYLRDLCARFGETMLPPTVSLDFKGEPVEMTAQTATTIGLIVNEWLTNAAKHAFPHGTGRLQVVLRREGDTTLIEVGDDGVGGGPGGGTPGTGAALIGTLAKSIGATVTVTTDGGRRCQLRVPG